MLPRLGEQLGPVLGQQGLVGRHHVLSGFQRLQEQAERGTDPAHHLDHDGDFRIVEDLPGIAHDPIGRDRRGAGSARVADDRPPDLDLPPRPPGDPVAVLGEQPRDPRADRPQPQHPDRHTFHPAPSDTTGSLPAQDVGEASPRKTSASPSLASRPSATAIVAS